MFDLIKPIRTTDLLTVHNIYYDIYSISLICNELSGFLSISFIGYIIYGSIEMRSTRTWPVIVMKEVLPWLRMQIQR